MSIDILNLTVNIVSAYVANNALPADDFQALIRHTYQNLSCIGDLEPVKAVSPEPDVQEDDPAVPVKKSVFPDHLVCLCCGKSATMLKRHLMTAHGLTVDQYRAKWGLPLSYPMLAPNYSERRSEIAKASGLGRVR